ncbi:MAG TPA: nuclear transport factor 2 family protein [Candidatus Dormibacteraeota bacterium]|jgi:ketosteroid isomerase-like protein|nr:nuclear transport factor 2 family protein [Candidatus Dormibacteraeota bacterium]
MTAMEDKAVVRETLLRYAAAVDRKDWPLMATCFTADCTGVWNGVELNGVDAIVGYINQAASRFTVLGSMHMLTNIYVELDGDTASVETYAFSSLAGDSDGEVFLRLRGLRYRDVLVRQGGDWLIKHRDLSADWETRTPAVVP